MAGAPAGISDTDDALTINDLPDDMIIHLIHFLDIKSLSAVAKVCTRWQRLCLTPYVWNRRSLKVNERNFLETSENILPLVGKCLKNVKLYNMHSLEAALIKASLIRYCPHLTHIEINKSAVDSSIFDDLHRLPNLKFLSLYGTRIVKRYQGANVLVNGPWVNTAYNLSFEKLQYLETLILSDFPLTLDSLYTMLKCDHLISSSVSIDMRNMSNIPADFLESLLRTKQATLRELYIHGDTLNDDIMRHISNCTLLQVLYICTWETLSGSSLLHLSKLKNLQSLELIDKDFLSSDVLAFLSNDTFPQMTRLGVSTEFPLPAEIIETIKTNMPNVQLGWVYQSQTRYQWLTTRMFN